MVYIITSDHVLLMFNFTLSFLDMGCCWDPTKQYHCFYANADARALEAEKEQSGETTGPSAGFAAGMTALAFVIVYAVAGTTYYFVKK